MSQRLAGQFWVLDGPDGCGKSTQARLLSQWIAEQGVDVVSYRDPGTTLVGEKIRDILLDKIQAGAQISASQLSSFCTTRRA